MGFTLRTKRLFSATIKKQFMGVKGKKEFRNGPQTD